ncbi:hypothetical protein [Virgibacillus salexigens]|uniref:Uncharacterized protein n=1 Tax=Virgibacillus massiliensis TaxID=1462526 RepID=A0A024QAN4_9BACI|nr:hypothetical protein [Virgibacillus massiliensis]CDQ39539.1 hypothetical protein BN990_01844 [Virgibacillus massiliensis]
MCKLIKATRTKHDCYYDTLHDDLDIDATREIQSILNAQNTDKSVSYFIQHDPIEYINESYN